MVTSADNHLRRAVRALAGLDDAALDAVTPEAMRLVMMRRGWKRGADERGMLDSSLVVAECYVIGPHRAPVKVPLAFTGETRRMFVAEWAHDAAVQIGEIAPAEILAEALAWWDAP